MGYFFNSLGFANANIMTVFVFAVQLIAVLTNHRAYSMIAAVLSVLIFNFLFTKPRYTFHAYGEGYPVTFLIMFGIAFLTGTLALKLKNQAKQSEMVLSAQRFCLIQTRFCSVPEEGKKSSVKRDSSFGNSLEEM